MTSLGETSWAQLSDRLESVRRQVELNSLHLRRLRSEAELAAQQAASRRDKLRASIVARLQARLESQPVIDQAKGVIMARTGCSSAEAFDVLRRASQRTNTPVRVLASEIVEQVERGTGDRQSATVVPPRSSTTDKWAVDAPAQAPPRRRVGC